VPRGLLIAVAIIYAGCGGNASPPVSQSTASGSTVPEAVEARSARVPARLAVKGVDFLAGESPFEWRGITAFRLLEQIAHGRDGEAIAYLDWAGAQRVTVVRVLTMAKHLFELNPDDGLKALPRLLALASERS
jgi:hypothetical protein